MVDIQRSITTLKYEMEALQKRQDYGITIMETILDKLSSSVDSPAVNGSVMIYDIISKNNDEELEKMEEKLTTDRSYRNQLVIL